MVAGVRPKYLEACVADAERRIAEHDSRIIAALMQGRDTLEAEDRAMELRAVLRSMQFERKAPGDYEPIRTATKFHEPKPSIASIKSCPDPFHSKREKIDVETARIFHCGFADFRMSWTQSGSVSLREVFIKSNSGRCCPTVRG